MNIYDVTYQFVDSPIDESKSGGSIPAPGLVEAFRNFPYAEEIKRASGLSSPTFPTITFRRQSDGEEIAIWTTDTEEYDLCFVMNGKKWFLNSQRKEAVEAILTRFSTESIGVISPPSWWRRIFG